MSNPRIRYFEQEDMIHLVITDEPESRSVELGPNITVELNDKNEMIGVEILNASAFFVTLCWSRLVHPVRGEMFIDSIPKNLRLRSKERSDYRIVRVELCSAPSNGVE